MVQLKDASFKVDLHLQSVGRSPLLPHLSRGYLCGVHAVHTAWRRHRDSWEEWAWYTL